MKYTEDLNTILEKNYSAMSGYELAIEKVESPTLTSIFKEKESKRKKFIDELSTIMISKGEEPSTSESAIGKIHQFFMEISSEWSNDKEQSVLEECIRGEEELLEDYKDLLKKNPGTEVSVLLTDHATDLEVTINKLKELHQIGEKNKMEKEYDVPVENPATPRSSNIHI